MEELFRLEDKHTKSVFYELPNDHPDIIYLNNLIKHKRKKAKTRTSKNVMHIWTDEELNYLKENSSKFGTSELAKNLNLKTTTVRHKINFLNLPKKKRAPNIKQKDLDGNVLNVYLNAEVASNETGLNRIALLRASRENDTYKGFLWEAIY